jgi:PST family polysaccharide transporter
VRSSLKLSALSVALTQFINLGRSIILARLLARDDFGLFGMALTVSAALQVLTSFGLSASIVARDFTSERETQAYLNTVWTAELLRSLLVTRFVRQIRTNTCGGISRGIIEASCPALSLLIKRML